MIANFVPTVNVITSKQRPRKLTIKGSDGKEYRFLLKGLLFFFPYAEGPKKKKKKKKKKKEEEKIKRKK